jgi:hypothetical protein
MISKPSLDALRFTVVMLPGMRWAAACMTQHSATTTAMTCL